MSIISNMTTGASGLRAESEAMGATSDNIANVSTYGFKRERAVFEDVLGRSVMGSSAIASAGQGSRVSQIQEMWTQGALVTTGNPTDMALSGDGLFVVNGSVNGQQGQFYTRAGQFQTNSDGYLVNPDGLHLQGYTADANGVMGTQLGDLRVDGMTLPATPTSNVTLHANLNAHDSAYSQDVTIYDSLGQAHTATLSFTKTADNEWDWTASVPGADVAGGTAGTPFAGASGHLSFNADGSLATSAPGASSFSFNGATPGQSIAFDFGSSTTAGGTGLDGMTQLAQTSAVNSKTQDGFGGGQVAGISISQDGTITGNFGDGEQRALGQVAIARFASDGGLARTGQNLWSETKDSGQPLVGVAGTAGRGSVVAGSLEGSNVDLGTEFVDLIAYQRGFSANSKVITTADEMYQELVQMKR